jgi:hypothetical protein
LARVWLDDESGDERTVNLVEDYLATTDLCSAPTGLRSFRPSGTTMLTSRVETSRYAVLLLLPI